MVRVKRGVFIKRRHKKILNAAKGFYSARSRTFKVANQSVFKAKQYAYRDRKRKKRIFRKLWIIRIKSAINLYGLSYNFFIRILFKMGLRFSKKVLAFIVFKKKNVFSLLMVDVKNSEFFTFFKKF